MSGKPVTQAVSPCRRLALSPSRLSKARAELAQRWRHIWGEECACGRRLLMSTVQGVLGAIQHLFMMTDQNIDLFLVCPHKPLPECDRFIG